MKRDGFVVHTTTSRFTEKVVSLAAGGAAAIGSGAFATAEAERTVDVNVAADSNGFVELKALNDTYASGTGDGQLELDFNSDSGSASLMATLKASILMRRSISQKYSVLQISPEKAICEL